MCVERLVANCRLSGGRLQMLEQDVPHGQPLCLLGVLSRAAYKTVKRDFTGRPAYPMPAPVLGCIVRHCSNGLYWGRSQASPGVMHATALSQQLGG